MAKTPAELRHPKEYIAWCSMKRRVVDPDKAAWYKDVEVCSTWATSFLSFLIDMGKAPGPEYSLDRKDNSKGYNKENCRWATAKEQANNRTNNVKYNLHQDSFGKWVVRKLVNGKRVVVGRYPSLELVHLFHGIP